MKKPFTHSSLAGGGGLPRHPASPTMVDATNNTATHHPQQTSSAEQREIAIFWDFENVQLPSWAKAAEASKAIVNIASKYGRIVDRRLYFDFSGAEGGVWSALDSSGFDLVNTPRRNAKETLDKKLIADVLTFAWDSAVRNDNCKPCVVLLTSDGDYAYTLSKLRDRGVMSIVFHGNDSSVASVLRASADIPMSFEEDVLKKGLSSTSNRSSTIPGSTGSSLKRNMALTPAALAGNDSRALSDARALCGFVSRAIVDDATNSEAGWLLASKAGVGFRKAISHASNNGSSSWSNPQDDKDRYRQARVLAMKKGWLLQGRRSLTGPDQGQIIMAPSDGTENDRTLYSLDDFLRVTFQGKIELQSPEQPNPSNYQAQAQRSVHSSSCALFIKNIPRSVHIRDLVQYLEQEHDCTIRCGNTERAFPMAPYCFARIQVEDPPDAERLIRLAKESQLQLKDRVLQVSYDSNSAPYSGDPAFYYERGAGSTPRKHAPLTSPAEHGGIHTLCSIMLDMEKTVAVDYRNHWLEGGNAAIKYKETVKRITGRLPDGDQFRAARTNAVDRRLIEIGRRVKTATGQVGRIEVVLKGSSTSRYSPELYVRLTEKGRQLVFGGRTEDGKNDDRLSIGSNMTSHLDINVLIKNLPAETLVLDLVCFLEKAIDGTICLASIDAKVDCSTTSCNARVQFANAQDGAKLLNLASSSDGLIFEGNALVAVPDSTAPSEGDDVKLFYKDQRQESIPSTVSTTSHSIGSSSALSTPETVDTQHDTAMFCMVLYEMASRFSVDGCPNAHTHISWQATGSVGEYFQNSLGSRIGSKERFKQTRNEVITQGLVELGRRRLDLEEPLIVVAPYFVGPGALGKNTSPETYLRLTASGVNTALEALELEKFEVPIVPPLKAPSMSSNIYLSNLPRDTNDVNELVAFLEHTCGTMIARSFLENLCPGKTTSSAHIEFDSIESAKKVMDTCSTMGLVYTGRALRAYIDNNVPNWEECDSQFLYTNKELVNANTIHDDDPTEEMDEPIDPSTPDPIEDTKTAESFEVTNLLFGDNLVMLYNYGLAEAETGTLDTTSMSDGGKSSSLQRALTVTPSPDQDAKQEHMHVEIPDLLWD